MQRTSTEYEESHISLFSMIHSSGDEDSPAQAQVGRKEERHVWRALLREDSIFEMPSETRGREVRITNNTS